MDRICFPYNQKIAQNNKLKFSYKKARLIKINKRKDDEELDFRFKIE